MNEKKQQKITSKEDFLNTLKQAEAEVDNREKAAEEAESEVRAKEQDVKEDEIKELYSMLESETGITKTQVDAWKDMYMGKVFVLRIDDKETYVYRYITRPEFKQIVSSFADKNIPEDLLNEQIFNKCVLYPTPSPELRLKIGAGTIDSIAFAIKLVSNFLSEDIIARSIVKL